MNITKQTRSGFTLVELLVVIAIIGILIGMLLPAVQAVRSTARRMSCANKMKQLALAVHNYESAHMTFPVSQVGPGKSNGPGYYSWLVPLLPFMEQENVYSQFDLSVNNGDASGFKISTSHPNALAASTVVDSFLCPSDEASDDNRLMGDCNPASSNYAGNIGWPERSTGVTGERAPGRYNGVIPLENPANPVDWHQGKVGFRDVTDGTSSTSLVSECLIQTGTSFKEIQDNLVVEPRLGSTHITRATGTLSVLDSLLNAPTHPHPIESAYSGRSWSSGYTFTAPTFVHVSAPNSVLGHFSNTATAGDFLVSPSSRHTGGVNLARVDASVSFISDDIEEEVWWALGSRDDGRVN